MNISSLRGCLKIEKLTVTASYLVMTYWYLHKRSLERRLRLTRSRLRPTTLSSPAVERGFLFLII
jgi:hypothetical protein